jgi:hypothetical protein
VSVNYYLRTADTPDGDEGVHLGKFARGCEFMFRAHSDLGVIDYDTWVAFAETGKIVAEYGREVTVEELLTTVAEARQTWGRFRRRTPYPDQYDDARGYRFNTREFC